MSKISLSDRIVSYMKAVRDLHPDKWINGGEIEDRSRLAGYKSSCGARRARELAANGIIARKDENGSVWYRYLKEEEKTPIADLITENFT